MSDPIVERRRKLAQQAERRLIFAVVSVLGLLAVAGAIVLGVVVRAKMRKQQDADPIAAPEPPERRSTPTAPKYFVYASGGREHIPFEDMAKNLPIFFSGELNAERDKNELRFAQTYHGQRFLIAGRADSLAYFEGAKTADLNIGHLGFNSVICEFDPADRELTKVRCGDTQKVLVEGTCVNSGKFTDCRIIKISN